MGVFLSDIEGARLNGCACILHCGSKGEWLCLYVTLKKQVCFNVFVSYIEGGMVNGCVFM